MDGFGHTSYHHTLDQINDITKALRQNHSDMMDLRNALETKEEEHKRVLQDLDLDSEAKVKRYKKSLEAFGTVEEMLNTVQRPKQSWPQRRVSKKLLYMQQGRGEKEKQTKHNEPLLLQRTSPNQRHVAILPLVTSQQPSQH